MYALAASFAGPPMPPILITSGTITPRQLGPMMRAPFASASSTIWATSRRGIRSVTITISSMPCSSASNTASLVKAGGTVTTEPFTGRAVVLDRLLDGVEHRHAVHVAALAAGRHAADDLRALAVVEALARQVHGLAPGDALHDEGGVLVDQDRHRSVLLPRRKTGGCQCLFLGRVVLDSRDRARSATVLTVAFRRLVEAPLPLPRATIVNTATTESPASTSCAGSTCQLSHADPQSWSHLARPA